jgi:acetyl-CoA synthetase
MVGSGGRRGLSTARAALRVAWLLAERPAGVRADEVAAVLGKSASTAYNVLASLCEEAVAVRHPGGLYRLAPAFRDAVGAAADAPPGPHDLDWIAEDLLARTHKRAYVGVVQDGRLRVVAERGHQGMPRLPRLEPEVGAAAHALAMGKVVLALARPEAVDRYLAAGLARFTRHTLVDPEALRAELAQVRRRGVAADCEEFELDFCCLAAPLFDAHGDVLAVAGVSMSRRAFDDERPAIEETLRDVAHFAGAFQASADPPAVLAAAPGRDLVSAVESTIR